MQVLSEALKNAIDAGNKQRVLLVFGNKEFSNEDIVMSAGVTLSEEFISEQELTIGLTPSYMLTFSMLNDRGQMVNFDFGWFNAYIGARIDSGTPTEITRTFTENGQTVTYAFAPLGTFYAEKPDIVVKKSVAVTAYDQMIKFGKDMPSLNISYPTTVGAILSAMCTNVGVTLASNSSTFLNYDLVVASKPDDFDMATMRTVLGWIAEVACSNAHFNRDGQLEISWFTTTSEVYDENSYKEFTPSWYETAAINGVYFRDTNEFIETSNGTTKTNNYLIQDNPFLLDRSV